MTDKPKESEDISVTLRSNERRHVAPHPAEPIVAASAHEYGEMTTAGLSGRARTRKTLRESERRYRNFFENAKDAIYVHDLTGRYTLVNRAGEALLGYSRAEILQMHVFDIVPREYFEQIRSSLTKKLADHAPTIYETEVVRKDGMKVPVEVNSQLIYEHGMPAGVQGTARDISERRRAEEALRDSEERFRGLFENAKDVVFTCDLSGQFTSLNRAGEKLIEYSRDEALQSNFARIVTPEYIEMVRQMLAGKAAGDASTTYEIEVITKSGRRVWVEIGSRTVHKDGRPIGVQGSARDITERKRAEEALRRSEEQYRVLFESNPQPMWVFDLETFAFLALNEFTVRHYGYTREEFLSMTLWDLYPLEDRARLEREQLNKIEGLRHLGEWRHRTAAGETINVEITANVTGFGGKKAGLVLVNDITERKRTEEALRASQAQLQQSQKLEAIGQLAGGVAHDFNNLLTVISGHSELSLRRLDQVDPVRRSLEEIKAAAGRAASLTRQLLAFSRKQMLEPRILDLNTVVKDMYTMLRRLIGEDIDLATGLADDLGKVRADPGQVEQIIMNLVVNARDAMPRGGKVTIETSNITLDDEYAAQHLSVQTGSHVMLAISDTGCGMDKEIQSHIFEPFFTTKESGRGTGLGLSTVYGIVKQSGGYLWVYSEVGVGTTFKVYLPRVAGEKKPDMPSSHIVNLDLRGDETVLLVEDEDTVRRTARLILESNGYHVVEAVGALEALRLCEENARKIDLMVTDVIMPEMSGRVLAERVAERCPGLPVLYMSGYTDDAIVRHGLMGHLLEFIQKPFTPEALVRKVREVLDKDK